MEYLSYAVAGVAFFFTAFIFHAWLADRAYMRKQIALAVKIHDCMNQALEGRLHRFLILKSENGGGRPSAGAHLYASVLYEDFTPPIKSVKPKYQRFLMDAPYLRMLQDIISQGHVDYILSRMEPGMLRDLYASEGIYYSRIFFIKQTKTAMYYGSISTTIDENLALLPEESARMTIAINRLRELFKNIQ